MSRFDVSRFRTPPDDEFVCGICMNVLDEAKESPCRHVFCNVCITRALEEKSKCPICRATLYEVRLKAILPLVQNLLNKLLMNCEFQDSGCEDVVPLEAYISHVENCDFKTMTCQNTRCNLTILKRDMASHESECPFRTFVCGRGCECDVFYVDRDTHVCLDTLLLKYKEAREKIEQLENRVKELSKQTSDRRGFNNYIDYDNASSLSADDSYHMRLSAVESVGIELTLSDLSSWTDCSDDGDVNMDLGWFGRGRRRRHQRHSHASTVSNNDGGDADQDNNSGDAGTGSRVGEGLADNTTVIAITDANGDAGTVRTGESVGHDTTAAVEGPGTSRGRTRRGDDEADGQRSKRAKLGQGGEADTASITEVEQDGDDGARSLRRSDRLRNIPADPVPDSNDSPFPPASSMLQLFTAGDESWSSDDSWTPE